MPEETRQTAEGRYIAQADRGGYASVVDARTCGFSAEQVQKLIQASTHELKTVYQGQVDDLSQKLDATNEAVISFFHILDENQVPLKALPEKLTEIANRHREMLARLAVLELEDPAIKALVEAARAAIKETDYDRADQLLNEAETAELAAVRMAAELVRQAQEAANQRCLKAAKIMAERGELSLTRLNYREAARHFQEASKQVPPPNRQERNDYLSRYAYALYRQGTERVDDSALNQAIQAYREILLILTDSVGS